MSPALRWLLWAGALFALTGIVDIALLALSADAANVRPLHAAGVLVSRLLGAYLVLGLVATALFWSRGKAQDAGTRLVATIAFLIAQGLLFAFMSLATLLSTPHRRWDELAWRWVPGVAANTASAPFVPPCPGNGIADDARGIAKAPPAKATYSCERLVGAAPASAMRHRYRLA